MNLFLPVGNELSFNLVDDLYVWVAFHLDAIGVEDSRRYMPDKNALVQAL